MVNTPHSNAGDVGIHAEFAATLDGDFVPWIKSKMKSMAVLEEFTGRDASYAIAPVIKVAITPNQAGIYTQTSFSGQESKMYLLIHTAVNCIPGYIVVPTGRPRGYHTFEKS